MNMNISSWVRISKSLLLPRYISERIESKTQRDVSIRYGNRLALGDIVFEMMGLSESELSVLIIDIGHGDTEMTIEELAQKVRSYKKEEAA